MHANGARPEAPRYIAVEGPIGVGKTSLCRRLARTFGYDMLLERSEENPFLDRFYQHPGRHALATQLFFLLQRARQIQELQRDDLFGIVRVADFLIEKDQLFARETLDPDEYALYLAVYRNLALNAPVPDLVIYLQAPSQVLLERIQQRGIPSEQHIDKSYLDRLNRAYTEFFHYYDKSSLLIVNSGDLDLVNNEDDYQQLVDYILKLTKGTHFFNPRPTLL